MKTSIEEMQAKFFEDLLDANLEQTELIRLNLINRICEHILFEVNQLLKKNLFDNEVEEIDFFKNVNPQFLSPSLEEGVKYNIITNKPITTSEDLIVYYEEALRTLQSFFSMNNFHYQYYKNNFQELDRVYFLRNAGPVTIPILEISSAIKATCPPMSYLFAKFMAYENVQRFIITQIDGLRASHLVLAGQNGAEENIEIKWTGDVINVVELAYGLWLTGQINNGNASLNQIVRWLEKDLSVSIGIAQRKFTEIGRRKRISVTKFLDQMKEAILRKVDNNHE